MSSHAEVIVIGGGHNGLTCAAYLAKAGASVILLEQREVLGGSGTSEATIPELPGFTFNAGAFDLLDFESQPVFRDFKLDELGLELIENDPMFFMPFENGAHIMVHRSVESTAESIERISAKDAQAYVDYVAEWTSIAELIGPYMESRPPRPRGAVDHRSKHRSITGTIRGLAKGGRTLRRASRNPRIADITRAVLMPARNYLMERFESPEVQGLMAFWAMSTKTSLDIPGSVLAMSEPVTSHAGGVTRPRGGIGEVSLAIARAFRKEGGTIRLGADVSQILIRNGRASGVQLADGEVIEATAAVVTAISPQRVFLDLIAEDELDSGFRAKVRSIQNDNIGVIKAYFALDSAPVFSTIGDDGSHPKFRTATGMVCEGIAAADLMWRDLRAGILPEVVGWMWCTLSTGLDSTMAPDGHHALGLHTWVPYEFSDGGTWDKATTEKAAFRMLKTYARYAPGIEDHVIGWSARSPVDWERITQNPRGNNFHVDFVPHQILGLRPLPELSHYRAPIDGLYLSGAGTHPGPGITGLPGHNTAMTVLEDLSFRG